MLQVISGSEGAAKRRENILYYFAYTVPWILAQDKGWSNKTSRKVHREKVYV